MSKTWQPVEIAAWTALVLGTATATLFSIATHQRSGPPPSLLYPYLASACVFVTTCVWILFDVSATSTPESPQDARRWAARAFCIVFAVLVAAGMAGKEGTNAVMNLNWYLFGDPVGLGHGELAELLTRPFNYIAASGNALSLATLVYIGVSCRDIASKAHGELDVHAVLTAGRRLGELLVYASALMVTSTLSLYLLFASAEQIEQLQAPPGSSSASPGRPVEATVLKLQCTPRSAASGALPSGASAQDCLLTAESVAATAPRRNRSASVMALVAGLSFTGALFILFMSFGGVVDRRMETLLNDEIRRKTEAAQPFSVKTWKEEHGVAEPPVTQRVLQALALLAPALTGAFTLVVSS